MSGTSVPKTFKLGLGAASSNFNKFGQDAAVASGATSVVVDHLVGNSETFFLTQIEFDGDNIAFYEVFIDGVKEAAKTTWFSGGLNGTFFFNNLEVTAMKKIELKVTNFRPTMAAFRGRILGGTVT